MGVVAPSSDGESGWSNHAPEAPTDVVALCDGIGRRIESFDPSRDCASAFLSGLELELANLAGVESDSGALSEYLSVVSERLDDLGLSLN